ncbi:MAG: mitochondrial fission ELM1 family protein, partial [Candidatus Omnitrophica bacterium]|nr:mitochondrial fission ELM1 family protein [Candidatus Omnitrophota bacterium]
IVISCGASTVAVNAFLKYENNAKGICIMKPGLGRSRKFDLVILPKHDVPARSKSNMLVTEIAPNRITTSATSEVASTATSEVAEVRCGIGLLIGGDAKGFRLKKEDVEKVVDGVLKMGREIFVSTSRRTSPEIDKLVKEKLSGKCKLLVIANENNKQGVVQEIFDKSEVIIVSPESISMISEAVSSGRRVVVFGRAGGKYNKAIANLEQRDYIKTAAPDKIYDVVNQILTERPEKRKLEDRKRIAKRLQSLM